jgi:DNA-binding NarL/FixJ family response regulator
VVDVGEFLAALDRVAAGGAALDPEVVRQLLARDTRADAMARLTAREREVLAAMAEGLANPTIAARLYVSASAVEKHVAAIFEKLEINAVEGVSRRVLAVLAYLGDTGPA